MKKALLTFAILTAAAVVSRAATVSQWTFETAPPADLSNSTTGPSIAADVGNGTATGLHASTATDWSTPAGNGSANSFSVNTWAVGDYWQFSLDTSTFSGLQLDFDQTGSGTGPRDFQLAYSSTGAGGAFTNFGSPYSLIVSNWTSTATNTGFHYSFDLSSVTALDNNPNVVFRLIDSSTTAINGTATVAAAGTDRVDDFTVSTAAVPEPSVIGMIGLGVTLVAGAIRYRRRSA